MQHTATHCNTLQHTATHCNTLQHTATHCNTLQHTATHIPCKTANNSLIQFLGSVRGCHKNLIWMSHVTHVWMSLVTHVRMSRITCMNNLGAVCDYHEDLRMSRVTLTKESCRSYVYKSDGVAAISRPSESIGLFCKRALEKRRYSAKETYDFKEPNNRSRPIRDSRRDDWRVELRCPPLYMSMGIMV